MVKLLGSTENEIAYGKNGENKPHLEITEVILVHWNIANNGYQHDLGVLYTFIPNKSFAQSLEILLKHFKMHYTIERRERIIVKGYEVMDYCFLPKIREKTLIKT